MPTLTAELIDSSVICAVPNIYLVGVAGAGMKALAEVLLDDGWSLSGSDISANSDASSCLAARGVQVASEHNAKSISERTDLLIYSAAIPETNPERERAQQLGIPQLSYFEAVSRITNSMPVVAVAGTHGKSSTTAWIVAMLEQMKCSPTFFCGAQRLQDGRNGQLGKQQLAIIEACEFRNHFHALQPQQICLMGIESDHFDCFQNLAQMEEAYRIFLQRLPANGMLIYNSDCHVSSRLAKKTLVQKIAFSISNPLADWYVKRKSDRVQIFLSGNLAYSFPFHLPGQHQLINLLAALVTVNTLGHDLNDPRIAARVLTPPKIKRRYETVEIGEFGTIIDDYAHHPTEIRMTLEAARIEFPNRLIRCCFQPHQLSRTQHLRNEFAEALSLADEIFILPVYGAREAPSPEFVSESQRLVKMLSERGVAARFIASLDQVWRTLETDASNQDILLTLGAGDITRIHNERTR